MLFYVILLFKLLIQEMTEGTWLRKKGLGPVQALLHVATLHVATLLMKQNLRKREGRQTRDWTPWGPTGHTHWISMDLLVKWIPYPMMEAVEATSPVCLLYSWCPAQSIGCWEHRLSSTEHWDLYSLVLNELQSSCQVLSRRDVQDEGVRVLRICSDLLNIAARGPRWQWSSLEAVDEILVTVPMTWPWNYSPWTSRAT